MTEEQQQALQKLYSDQKMVESNLSLQQQRLEVLQAYTTNIKMGLEVLNELEDKKDGDEMLMSVGGSIFVQAKVVNPEKVTRGIGSGVSIEQSIAEAKKDLEETIASLEKQLEHETKQYQDMLLLHQTISTRLQQLAEVMQRGG
jgi:prefoldin alpha subunit